MNYIQIVFKCSILAMMAGFLTVSSPQNASAFTGTDGGEGLGVDGNVTVVTLRQLRRMAKRDIPEAREFKRYRLGDQPNSSDLARELLTSFRYYRRDTLRVIRKVSRAGSAQGRCTILEQLQKELVRDVQLLEVDRERAREEAFNDSDSNPAERGLVGALYIWMIVVGQDRAAEGFANREESEKARNVIDARNRLWRKQAQLRFVDTWLRNPELEIR